MLDPKQLAAKLAPGREIYEHDELHELVAYGAAPIYTTLKTDPAKAMLSRRLFEAADLDTRLKLVREESMAIAVERVVVPALVRGAAVSTAAAYKVGLRMVREPHPPHPPLQ